MWDADMEISAAAMAELQAARGRSAHAPGSEYTVGSDAQEGPKKKSGGLKPIFEVILAFAILAAFGALGAVISGHLWPAVSHQAMVIDPTTFVRLMAAGLPASMAVGLLSGMLGQKTGFKNTGTVLFLSSIFLAPMVGALIFGMANRAVFNYSYAALWGSIGVLVGGVVGVLAALVIVASVLKDIGGIKSSIKAALHEKKLKQLRAANPDLAAQDSLEFSHKTSPAALRLKDVSAKMNQLEGRTLPLSIEDHPDNDGEPVAAAQVVTRRLGAVV